MTPRPNRGRRPRRGFALMLVVVYSTLVLSAWGVANRRTASILALKRAHADRLVAVLGQVVESRDYPREAATRGIALLETGDPPDETDPDSGNPRPYACKVTFSEDQVYVVKFVKDENDATRWTIDVTPSDQWSETPALEDLPEMPSSFAGTG